MELTEQQSNLVKHLKQDNNNKMIFCNGNSGFKTAIAFYCVELAAKFFNDSDCDQLRIYYLDRYQIWSGQSRYYEVVQLCLIGLD